MVSDAVPGPPWVMTKMVSKALSASMARMTTATMTKGSTSGQVMWRNICHSEAPSISADS